MKNLVTRESLTEGAAWTFVHSDGRRTAYRYDKRIVPAGPATDKGPGHDAMHALLNPLTGKCAMVTEKWLREGPIAGGLTGTRSHWLVGAGEMAVAA